MTLDEAYKKLGYEPLDKFTKDRLQHPVFRGDADRCIGATTWMVVEAALYVMDKHEAVITGHDLPYAERMADDVIKVVNKLTPSTLVHRKNRRTWTLGTGGILHWESDRTLPMWLRGRPKMMAFRDSLWKHYLRRRLAGPYGAIRRIVWDGKTYAAYSDTGEFLLTLDSAGAVKLVEDDPYRIEQVGWQSVSQRP